MINRRRRAAVALSAIPFLLGIAEAAPPPPTPPLEAYGALPEIERVAISPSGHEIAVVHQSNGERRLVILEDMTKPKVVYPIGSIKIRDLEWAGDDLVLLYLSKTVDLDPDWTKRKIEFFGATIVPVTGGKAEPVFGRANGLASLVQGRYGLRRIGGRWHGFFGAVELDKGILGQTTEDLDAALYDIDLANGMARRVVNRPGHGKSAEWLLDGQGRVAARLWLNNDATWWIANESGKRIVAGTQERGDVGLAGFGPDGTSIIYEFEDKDDLPHYMEVPLAGGEAKEFLADQPVADLVTDRTNNRLLGYVKWTDASHPVLIDPAKQFAVDKVMAAFPKLHVSLVDWTPDFGHLIVETSGNDDSGTYYAVDMNAMSASAIGYERMAIAPEQVGPISTIDYKAADGLAMQGVLTLPPGREPKNLPVVVLPHGGPEARDVAHSTGGRRPSPRAAMRSSSPTSAARPAMARPSATPASASGAARCRPTSPTASPNWRGRGSSTPSAPASSAQAMAAMRRWPGSPCSTASIAAPWPMRELPTSD